MQVKAFVDRGFPPGSEFCLKFLSSPEFNALALRKLAPSAPRQERKEDIASRIVQALDRGQLTPDRVLLTYVQQPRTWLSLKQGECIRTPDLKPPTAILREFGDEGWYGPIRDPVGSRKWYIRIHKVPRYEYIEVDGVRTIGEHRIRWITIAEVSSNYVALSWDGFTATQLSDLSQIDKPAQFPFWLHITRFYDELTDHFQGQWVHPNLHRLVLHDMWNKYLNTYRNGFYYSWQHLRIRAEAAGVALNAHSSGVAEINVKGLQVLSRHLAKSALETLELPHESELVSQVESALLRTLIKEWGTKSYEFGLAREHTLRDADSGDSERKVQSEELFKAHCYFGLKPESKTQDSLQHLKCYSGYANGSTSVLKFLLTELGIRG